MPLTGDVISGFLAMDSNLKFNPQQNIGHDALLKLIVFGIEETITILCLIE